MSLSDIEIKILQEKRNIELEGLGIEPELYYIAKETIKTYCNFIVSESGDIQVKSIENEQKVTIKNIVQELETILSVPPILGSIIVNEFVRDIVIWNRLKQIDPVKNWKFITSMYKLDKYIKIETEYNF